jgi:tetratricopeptide (TPR) repeat protein
MIATDNWFTLYNQGNALLELGLVDDAIAALQESIQLNAEFALSHRSLGDAYIYRNNLPKATDCFQKALDLRVLSDGTSLIFAFFIDGIEFDNLCKYDKALVYYSMAIEEEPHRPTIRISRGIVYARLERFAEALADFDTAVRLAPGDYLSYYNRGLCFIEMGRYREAVDDFSYALKLEPGDSETLLEYAEGIAVLRQMGDI